MVDFMSSYSLGPSTEEDSATEGEVGPAERQLSAPMHGINSILVTNIQDQGGGVR